MNSTDEKSILTSENLFKSLDNEQIDVIYTTFFPEVYPAYAGCYAKDEFKHLKVKAELGRFYIVNLDNSKGPGTHWVLLYCALKNHILYFDPFGAPPPKDIVHLVHPLHKQIIFSDDVLQNTHTELCGHYCIYISVELYIKKRDIRSIIMHDFTKNSTKNDERIKTFFKSIIKN